MQVNMQYHSHPHTHTHRQVCFVGFCFSFFITIQGEALTSCLSKTLGKHSQMLIIALCLTNPTYHCSSRNVHQAKWPKCEEQWNTKGADVRNPTGRQQVEVTVGHSEDLVRCIIYNIPLHYKYSSDSQHATGYFSYFPGYNCQNLC